MGEYNKKLTFVSGLEGAKSKLIKGNNLEVLKHLRDSKGMAGKIDLIYIDPPFATNNVFNMSEDKASSISRISGGDIAYSDELIGEEYLDFLRERLLILRDLLSEEGSIYLHIDYKIGHYVKVLMDEIFGINNFINDITRIKCNPKNFSRKAYGNVKDMILFYAKKSGNHIWNEPKIKHSKEDIERLFKKTDENGRRYTTVPVHAPGETANGLTGQPWKGMNPPRGRHWRYSPEQLDILDSQGLIEWSKNDVPRKKFFVDESNGKKIQDILEFKDPQKTKYPTEKNIELIELIVSASSSENSLVLDCFCGSGTTLIAASNLSRNWIGVDQSNSAVKISKERLDKLNDYEKSSRRT